MRLNGKLISPLIEAILLTYAEPDFQLLAIDNEDSFEVSWEHQTDGPYKERITRFIQLLNLKATITVFISKYRDSLNANQLKAASNFFSLFDKYYEKGVNNDYKYSNNIFHTPLIKGRLPFVDRKKVRDAFYKLTNENYANLILVNGKNQSGLSYIGWFASYISDISNHFKFIDINFKEIDLQTEGQVDDVDVANHIISKIDAEADFNAYRKENFKYKSFINQLNTLLDQKRSQEKYLFFFHQFNLTISENVFNMINAMVKAMCYENIPCYIMLSGYPRYDIWPEEILGFTESGCIELGIGSFNTEDLEDFFSKVYNHMKEKYEWPVDENTFVNQSKSLIPRELIDSETGNVVDIGRILQKWCRTITAN